MLCLDGGVPLFHALQDKIASLVHPPSPSTAMSSLPAQLGSALSDQFVAAVTTLQSSTWGADEMMMPDKQQQRAIKQLAKVRALIDHGRKAATHTRLVYYVPPPPHHGSWSKPLTNERLLCSATNAKSRVDSSVHFFGIDGGRVGEGVLALSSASGIGGTSSISRL